MRNLLWPSLVAAAQLRRMGGLYVWSSPALTSTPFLKCGKYEGSGGWGEEGEQSGDGEAGEGFHSRDGGIIASGNVCDWARSGSLPPLAPLRASE